MIDLDTFQRLKQRFRATGRIDDELYDLLADVVRIAARDDLLPRAWSPTGHWDAEARQDALHGWIERRLLRTGALAAAFDHSSAPAAFVRSLERSFRHYSSNAAQRSELTNLLRRAVTLMDSDQLFTWREYSGKHWWGLRAWADLQPWGGRDEDLLACAWAAGEFALLRYNSGVERASPTLSTRDLTRFLHRLLRCCGYLLDSGHIRYVLRNRFNLADVETVDIETVEPPAEPEEIDPDQALSAVAQILEDMSSRQMEVLMRRADNETLDEIAAALKISRGTVDNELRRVGVIIDRYRGEIPRSEILEILRNTGS